MKVVDLPRLDVITSLRFFFAFWVICTHYLDRSYLGTVGAQIVNYGWLAVPFFFYLSGFVLSYSYNDEAKKLTTLPFLKLRFARLYFGYFVALMLSFLLAQIQGSTHVANIWYYITLTQSWFLTIFLINGPSWSLSVEFFFYSIFPTLRNWLVKQGSETLIRMLAMVFISVLVVLTLLLTYTDTNPGLLHKVFIHNPLANVGTFVLGVINGLLLVRYWKELRAIPSWINNALFFSSFGLIILATCKPSTSLDIDNHVILLPLVTVLLTSGASLAGLAKSLMTWKPIVYLGEISYGLYIFQQPIKGWLAHLKLPMNFSDSLAPINFVIYLVVLIGVSAVIYSIETLIYRTYKAHIKNKLYIKS